MRTRSSIAVILSTGAPTLNIFALGDIPGARVVRAELAAGERAICVAATLEHDCSTSDLAEVLRRWARGRGWSVTVAPLT